MSCGRENFLRLKALVNKETNRVIFVEGNEDFADVFFCFLAMPLGQIIQLVCDEPSAAGIGCLNNLYRSVKDLDIQYFCNQRCREILLSSENAAAAQCIRSRMNIDYSYSRSAASGVRDGGEFVKSPARVMITDKLQARFLTLSSATGLSLLGELGITSTSVVEERNFVVGFPKVLELLRCSLVSETPLTETLLRDKLKSRWKMENFGFQNQHIKSPRGEEAVGSRNKIHVKLVVSKSKKIVCFAEAGKEFIDLLFSFLTIPLGFVVKEMQACASSKCIDRLYKSIEDLDAERYFKSNKHREMLVNPKLPPSYKHKGQLLAIEESTDLEEEDASTEGYVTEPSVFTITDDLIVTPRSLISGFSALKKKNLAPSDMEERDIRVGSAEAQRLLVAACLSVSALTDAFLQREPETKDQGFLSRVFMCLARCH